MLRVIFLIVAVLVRGFVVWVKLAPAIVFLAVAFLGAAPAFAAIGFAPTTGVKATDFLTLATTVEAVGFFELAFGLAEEVALAALAVVEAGFLTVGMAVKTKMSVCL